MDLMPLPRTCPDSEDDARARVDARASFLTINSPRGGGFDPTPRSPSLDCPLLHPVTRLVAQLVRLVVGNRTPAVSAYRARPRRSALRTLTLLAGVRRLSVWFKLHIMYSTSAVLATLVLGAAFVRADPTPNTPAPGDVYNEGAQCTGAWAPDTTGTWTVMNIELMTGNNEAMQFLECELHASSPKQSTSR